MCLGSNIKAEDTNSKVVQTTLFQDKLSSSSHIKVNGVQKSHSTTFTSTTPSSPGTSYTTLTDAKANVYFIPSPSKSILKVHVDDQTSKTDDGKRSTSGRYGTAWFHHGTSLTNGQYEYAVLVPTDTYHTTLTDLATAQGTTGSEVYKVLQKNSIAHVVQFLKTPKSWSTLSHPITGYVMFASSTSLPADGPVEEVSRGSCLIMAEETAEFIYLSISIPSLNLPTATSPLTNSEDVEQEELYHSSSTARKVEVKLRKEVQKSIVYVQTHGEPDCYKPNVWVLHGRKKNSIFKSKQWL